MKILLEGGADASTIESGEVLNNFAKEGNFAALACLIEEAAMNPDTPDGTGKTPLYWAQLKGHRAMSDWLRKLPRQEGDPVPEWNIRTFLVSNTP